MPRGNAFQPRPLLDVGPVSAYRRAAYRRVLAVLRAEGCPFAIGGAFGLSYYLGRLVDGPLEVFFRPQDSAAFLGALGAAGLRAGMVPDGGAAEVKYGEHSILLRWRLPPPLGGDVDDAWLSRARRAHFLDLRVRMAPAEELLWLILTTEQEGSLANPYVGALLSQVAGDLDWVHLRARLVGQEALLLSHIFLLFHTDSGQALAIHPAIVKDLLSRVLPDH